MKFVARLLVLLPLLWVDGVWAVDCPDTNYDLSSQAEVDALGATGCERVSGYLYINSADITNLDGLASLTSVGGNLYISNNAALTTLDGLVNLTSVGGKLRIFKNDALADLDGLIKLTDVGSDLFLYLNAALTNLDGLASLTSVGGYLTVTSNASLINLGGLTNLTSVSRGVTIWDNDALTNLDGLDNIASGIAIEILQNDALANIDGLAKFTSLRSLWVEGNDALTNLNGLAGLNIISAFLWITDTVALSNLDDLANLTSVRDLRIANNAALTNLDGLANTSVAGSLDILNNDALTELDGLAKTTSPTGYLYISDNDALINLDGLVNLISIGSDLGNVSNAIVLRIQRNAVLANCKGVAPILGWPSGTTPDDSVGGEIVVESNGIGCNSAEEILASVSGPTQPVINQASASSNSISLGFTPSTTTDTAFPITSYSAFCTGSDVDVSGSPATDLLDNTPITETLTVTGYDPTSVLASIEVDLDITHSDPSDLYITLTTPEGTELILWNQGSTGGEDLVGTFPTTLTSVDSLDSVTRQTMDGDWVLSIEDIDVGPLVREGVLNSWGLRITEELARNGSSSPIEVFGATRGRDYACTVAPVTKLGTTPVSDPYTVTVPLELPSVPTITSTDYEDGKIILTVSVSDNGGTDITGYEATCTDGTNTFTGTSASSPITVSGLTNDVAYTCTVTATNSVGTSSASVATDPITPEEASTGLPIWLLYQATQQ